MDLDLKEGFLNTWQPDTKQFNGIMSGLNEALVIYDNTGHLSYINVAALAQDYCYLYPHSDKAKSQNIELRSEAGDPLELENWPLARALRGETFNCELRVRFENQQRIHNVSGWLVRQDESLHVLKAFDITERREAEARFSTCFNDSPIPTILLSLENLCVIDVNESFLQMTGFTRKEVMAQSLDELNLFASKDADTLDRAFRKPEELSGALEVELKTRKGEACQIAISNKTVSVNGQACLLGTLIDISERKRTEEQLTQALQEVMQDTAWFSRSVMEKLAQIRQSPEDRQESIELTKRERQLLELIAKGLSNHQIEAELALAKTTVRNYVSRIYDKLGVHSRAEAIVWARERGIVA